MIFKSFKQKPADKQTNYGNDTFYKSSSSSSIYKTKLYPEELASQEKIVHQCTMEVSMEIKLIKDRHQKITQETQKEQQLFYNQLHEIDKKNQKPLEKTANKSTIDYYMKKIKQKHDTVQKKITDKASRYSDKIIHTTQDLKHQIDSCQEILAKEGKDRQIEWAHSIDTIGQLLFNLQKCIRDEKHEFSMSLNSLQSSIWKMQENVQSLLQAEKRHRNADHTLITNLIEAAMAKLIMLY